MKNPSVGEVFIPYRRFNGSLIPEQVSRFRGLSPGAKLVYGRLGRYSGAKGKVFPAVPTLAAEVGQSPRQTLRYLQELERKKFILIEHRRGYTSDYKFLWHEVFEAKPEAKRKSPQSETSGVAQSGSSGVGGDIRVMRTPAGSGRRRESIEESHHHQESHLKESQSDRDADQGDSLSVSSSQPERRGLSRDKAYQGETVPRDVPRSTSTPEQEFVERIRKRHALQIANFALDSDQCLRNVLSELRNCDASFAEFLEFDTQSSTGKPKNPHGYYRDLARRFAIQHRDAALSGLRLAVSSSGSGARDKPPSCEHGCADGLMSDGTECCCKAGQVWKQLRSLRPVAAS